MSQITEFTRTNAKALNKEIVAALAKLGEKYGVAFSAAGGSLGTSTFTSKIEVAIVNPKTGKAESKIAADFKHYAPQLGIAVKFLNKKMTIHGKEFKLVGLNPSSRLFPFIGETSTGSMYKFSPSDVRIALGIN